MKKCLIKDSCGLSVLFTDVNIVNQKVTTISKSENLTVFNICNYLIVNIQRQRTIFGDYQYFYWKSYGKNRKKGERLSFRDREVPHNYYSVIDFLLNPNAYEIEWYFHKVEKTRK